MEENGLTQETMVAALNRVNRLEKKISRSQVANWCAGINPPAYYLTVFLALRGTGWVEKMALELLAVMRPDLWKPAKARGAVHIGKRKPGRPKKR